MGVVGAFCPHSFASMGSLPPYKISVLLCISDLLSSTNGGDGLDASE